MSGSSKSRDEALASADFVVKGEDLVVRSRTEALLDGLAGFGFAMLGFLPLSVGTRFFDWVFVRIGVSFLILWFAVGIVVGTLTYYSRPKIPRHFLVGQELAVGYSKYRSFVIWSFVLASIVAIVGLAFTYAPRAWQNASVGLTLDGIAYFGLIPSLTTAQVLKSDNGARLSLLQFLKAGTKFTQEKVWLRRGLRRVEDSIPEDGILTVERDSLFLGCSYQIYNGVDVGPDLITLSNWVMTRTPARSPSIERFLASAGEARNRGLSSIPTLIEKIMGMPGWVWSIIAGVAFYFLILTLPTFGVPNPIIQGLKEIFGRG